MGDGNSKYGKTIIYTRVPIPNQKDDLQNQVEYLKQYANAKDIVVDEIFEEVGRGLDYNHKKWNKLIKDCMLGLIKTIIVANNEKASPEQEDPILNKFSMGIDLGLKDFAICSNGKTYKNINNSSQIRKLEKRLRREQRSLSRKYESYKRLKEILKGEATRQNIQKQKLKVQKLHQRLNNIRKTDYINKVISELVKAKPMWVTVENLNVSGMMKNRHLSKVVAQQKFFGFRTKLLAKCNEYGIELRVVDRFYPSSKTCHCCGNIKSDLKLSDRTYQCDKCGYTEDRNYNASLNLRDCQTYDIA